MGVDSMKTPEDEAFDDLAQRQGDWGGGYQAKRKMAADKLQDETDMLTIAYLYGYERGKKAALAQPAQEPHEYDWSMLEAAKESLREHMARIKELEAALKQALEALEESIDTVRHNYEADWRHGYPTRKAQLNSMKQGVEDHEHAITAIKAALAQPESEIKSWGETHPRNPSAACSCEHWQSCVECRPTAHAQPAQEPWRESASDYERGFIDGMQKQSQSSVDKAVNAMTQPTYYIPSKDQRPWVGLTDAERQDIALEVPMDAVFITEAKLKEKNNG